MTSPQRRRQILSKQKHQKTMRVRKPSQNRPLQKMNNAYAKYVLVGKSKQLYKIYGALKVKIQASKSYFTICEIPMHLRNMRCL